jgi:glucokinase
MEARVKKGLRLGIDLGGTMVKLALVNEKGRCLAVKEVATVKAPARLAGLLMGAAKEWLSSHRIVGTGVGVAGDVDSARGIVRFAPNLKWKNVPIKQFLRRAGIPAPVHVENDATAAAWGVFHTGLKKKSRNLVVLTLGTGVGGGLVFDGKLYRGATGSAGEIGHMVLDPSGPVCPCGNRGCFEATLGGVALARRGKAASPYELYLRARKGNRAALAVWKEAGRALGQGLANLINVLNPDTIALVGGVAGAAPLLLKFARPALAKAFQTPRRAARIVVPAQNKHTGVIGAALLVE